MAAVTYCAYCRKRIRRQRNGAWYHDRNSSTACYFGSGSDRRATPGFTRDERKAKTEVLSDG